MSDLKPSVSYDYTNAFNGWLVLSLIAISLISSVTSLLIGKLFIVSGFLAFVSIFLALGIFQLEPNQVGVATLFGKSKGNFIGEGILFRNPLYKIQKISTRTLMSSTGTNKISDLNGNPIMATLLGKWYVCNPANSIFNIDTPIEIYCTNVFNDVLRKVVSEYAYDGTSAQLAESIKEKTEEFSLDLDDENDETQVFLRDSSAQIHERIVSLAQPQLDIAGVKVLEASLVDVSYAPEIASAMLQTQQAEAFINARKLIVDGASAAALGALKSIEMEAKSSEQEIDISSEKKAELVSKLMLVLCSDTKLQPVLSLDESQ